MSAKDCEKWDAIHQERGFFPPHQSPHLSRCQEHLPSSRGPALDVAGGTGRHALWLAEQGFEASLAEISPAALSIAEEEATARGIALKTIRVDLEQDPFPKGPWDVILCFHYLHRPLFKSFAETLSPSGILVFVQPTLKNLERHPRPSARYLLAEGEMPDLARANGLEVVVHEEGWTSDQRHEAFMIAKSRDRIG